MCCTPSKSLKRAAPGCCCRQYVKDKDTIVILTCPAYFDARERQLMVHAARIAGLADEQLKAILDEPSAGEPCLVVCWWVRAFSVTGHSTLLLLLLLNAGLLGAVGIEGVLKMCREGCVVCVVDMGGGTMDVSVIRMTMQKGMAVACCIAVASNLCLGGEDVDAVIVDLLVKELGEPFADVCLTWRSLPAARTHVC